MEDEKVEKPFEDPIMEDDKEDKSFKDLGVNDQLVEACETLGWKSPTKIQIEAIPIALEGKDIIGLAQTGSSKTGAFAIPIIQALLEAPQAFFACVMSPTRELAIQIAEQFEALGAGIGLKSAVLVGGVDHVHCCECCCRLSLIMLLFYTRHGSILNYSWLMP